MDEVTPSDFLSERYDKLAELGLGLGAHLINGWSGQFDRMERFYTRFTQAEDSQEALDYALTFFVFANSLSDWILKWEKLDIETYRKRWDNFVSKHPEMKVGRDIGNVTKHLRLNYKESIDEHFAVIWAYDPFVTKKSEWVIHFGDRRMTLGDLIYQILTGWKRFIEQELGLEREKINSEK